MSEAVEGEIIPPGGVIATSDQLDPDAIELGRTDRRGRPSDMTPDVVTKLIAAFHNGYNITEACQYADISRTTYYRWLEDDDDFSYKMSVAQTALHRKSKAVVADAIQRGDPNISLRFLTLRDPDFKPKLDATSDVTNEEARNNLRGVLDAIAKHDPSSQPPATDGQDSPRLVEGGPTDIS